MARIIKLDGTGKQRTRFTRSIVVALRELMKQTEPNQDTRDISSYIVLALKAIDETIDLTVEPWEKRGYWIKADRFRMKWVWASQLADELNKAIIKESWQDVAILSAKVIEKLGDVAVPKRHKIGTPWIGAWEELRNRAS